MFSISELRRFHLQHRGRAHRAARFRNTRQNLRFMKWHTRKHQTIFTQTTHQKLLSKLKLKIKTKHTESQIPSFRFIESVRKPSKINMLVRNRCTRKQHEIILFEVGMCVSAITIFPAQDLVTMKMLTENSIKTVRQMRCLATSKSSPNRI